MPLGKRKRTSYATRARNTRAFRSPASLASRMKYKKMRMGPYPTVAAKVNTLYKMIETKESTQTTDANIALPHNNVYIVQSGGSPLNVLKTYVGADDPMAGVGSRIGDKVTLRGIKIVAFLENALERTKVHYRIMLLRCPRGVSPTRANLFKGDSNNKMIDQVNTEKFSIVWQSRFNIQVANGAANALIAASGVPIQTVTSGGQGTKIVTAWIPGRKFGRGGNITYENVGVDPKFYDYRLVVVAYDWYGTPQDVNNVGKINELYTKAYYKDA